MIAQIVLAAVQIEKAVVCESEAGPPVEKGVS
jgi:hypothetical protein